MTEWLFESRAAETMLRFVGVLEFAILLSIGWAWALTSLGAA